MAVSKEVGQEVVEVGGAGAANVGVLQEVENVKGLEYLRNTPPPVAVLQKTRADVDNLHVYLLVHSVAAVAYHAGKSPQARGFAIASMKAGKKDVLVATKVELQSLERVLNVRLAEPVPVRLVTP